MAARSECTAGLGLVLLQDFDLIVWSGAGGREEVDKKMEDAFSPGPVLCWTQPEHGSLTLVHREITDGKGLERLV